VKQYPNSTQANDAAYNSFQLKLRSPSPLDTVASAQDFLQRNPASGYRDKVFMSLGTLYLARGNFTGAIQVLDALIAQCPKSSLLAMAWLERAMRIFWPGRPIRQWHAL